MQYRNGPCAKCRLDLNKRRDWSQRCVSVTAHISPWASCETIYDAFPFKPEGLKAPRVKSFGPGFSASPNLHIRSMKTRYTKPKLGRQRIEACRHTAKPPQQIKTRPRICGMYSANQKVKHKPSNRPENPRPTCHSIPSSRGRFDNRVRI